jgi:hypothetical protein
MAKFNYHRPVEFYCQKNRGTRRGGGLFYRRFSTGAEAVRFAMEDVAPVDLTGCMLEVEGERFDAAALKDLYASSDYPLRRGRHPAKA